MKIKELFEQDQISGKDYTIQLWLQYNSLMNTNTKLKNSLKKITKAIDEKTGISGAVLVLGNSGFDVCVIIPEHEVDSIANYMDNVNAVLKQFVDVSEIREASEDHRIELKFINKVPSLPIPIAFPSIFIDALGKTSLSGIDKIIKDFDYLEVSNAQHITDSVLGLVKLAKHGTINVSTSDYSKLEWANIISRHYRSGNILACVNELRTKGLLKYAQF
jgi:hypothetical protein